MSTIVRVNPNVTTTQVIRLKQIGLQGANGAGLAWKNAGWVTATAYIPDDALLEGDSSYRCILAHTSSATTLPGSGADWATYWVLLAGSAGGVWYGTSAPPSTDYIWVDTDETAALVQASQIGHTPTTPDTTTTVQTALDNRALKQSGKILGQMDVLTVLTPPVDGGTVTVNCSLGNAFQITPTDVSGYDYTVDFTNVPTGSVFFALSLLTITGANIPTVTYKVAGAARTPLGTPTFSASKKNQWTVATWDNGTTLILSGAAY